MESNQTAEPDQAGAAPAAKVYDVDEKGRTVYPLKKQIQWGSDTLVDLRFRKLKAKDLRGMPIEGRTMSHVLDVIGKVCGQPAGVIDELSAEDLQEVSSIVGVF